MVWRFLSGFASVELRIEGWIRFLGEFLARFFALFHFSVGSGVESETCFVLLRCAGSASAFRNVFFHQGGEAFDDFRIRGGGGE